MAVTTEYDSTTAALLSLAERAYLDAGNVTQALTGINLGGGGPRDAELNFFLVKPKVEDPPAFADLFDMVEAEDDLQETIDRLSELTDEWVAKYFPAINGNFSTIPETWLATIIAGAGSVGSEGFAAAWHASRDRAYRTRRSEVDNIDAAFSARGFSLPPGAMAAQVAEAEQRVSETAIEESRVQTIKDADLRYQLLQLATQTAASYKVGMLNALANFFSEWNTLKDKNYEKARIKVQAATTLSGILTSFYNVEHAFEQLRLQAEQGRVDALDDIDKNAISRAAVEDDPRSTAAAVQAFADIASNAASAASSLVARFG